MLQPRPAAAAALLVRAHAVTTMCQPSSVLQGTLSAAVGASFAWSWRTQRAVEDVAVDVDVASPPRVAAHAHLLWQALRRSAEAMLCGAIGTGGGGGAGGAAAAPVQRSVAGDLGVKAAQRDGKGLWVGKTYVQ
jgi:hypothetical protein